MPTSYKTPGVYLVEKDAFPGSVVEVATAIPAFTGYTEKAEYNGKDLTNKPFRITSFAEYLNIFGGAPTVRFTYGAASAEAPAVSEDSENAEESADAKNGEQKAVLQTKPMFRLYDSMRIFFQNGGAACYICSVGGYDKKIEKAPLFNGIAPFVKEQEPTIMLVPDAVSLGNAQECADIQNELLAHCNKMQNRFAILDVFDGYKEPLECINTFREKVTDFLKYGAAYYPWINTSVVASSEVSFTNIEPEAEGGYKTLALDLAKSVVPDVEDLDNVDPETHSKRELELVSFFKSLRDFDAKKDDATALHNTLTVVCPKYAALMNTMSEKLNLMPPSAAMAGIYTRVDNNEGVWKAPANVGVNGVVSPAVNLTNDEQEDLNVPLNGKAVNAIRYFVGDGIKVWGARTLDGNSLDWRYVNVRRTMIMLEESIKQASKAYVFDANTSTTWLTMKNMIGNFLNSVWKRGGLAGTTPEDAYEVHVGLGDTMTPEDILEGILRVTVKVALIRPAEFIELTFQQQQQKS